MSTAIPEPRVADDLTFQQREAVEALAARLAGELADGAPRAELAAEIVAGECPEPGAGELVDAVAAASSKDVAADPPEVARAAVPARPSGESSELRDRYARKMLFGFLWAAGGAMVTAISYGAASDVSGGRYVVAYGAILYGLVSMAIGYDGWSKHR